MFSSRTTSKLAVLLMVLFMVSTATVSGEDLSGKTVSWKLKKGRIIDPGQTNKSKDGELTLGYIVEADASSSDAPIKKGFFRATLSSFSPAKDLVGQKKGVWYVNGTWEIIDKRASKEKVKAKHSDAVIRGRLQTQLDFDPTQTSGNFVAETELPMSHLGSNWGRGKGFFQGNQDFEGDLELTMERWQKVK